MSVADIHVSADKAVSDIDFSKLDWQTIVFHSNYMSPRDFGHDYDDWEDYYEDNPDSRPEYCECCGNRL